MPSQNTLIWVGAAAFVVVAAGAGAVVWTHAELLEPNPADIPVVASAPVEPKPPILRLPRLPFTAAGKRSGARRQAPTDRALSRLSTS